MRQLVNPRHKELSVRAQTELLEIPRSTLYYKPIGESPENLEIMQKMDKHHIEHPTCGVLGMQDMLRLNGFQINHKRIRRLMRLMNIRVKYPQKSLSDPGARKYILPYLLRGLDIVKTNQVWSIDISYIPMKQGFMYLTAIMDVRSRYIVGWSLSNTLEKSVFQDCHTCLCIFKIQNTLHHTISIFK
jgi:putative transposase